LKTEIDRAGDRENFFEVHAEIGVLSQLDFLFQLKSMLDGGFAASRELSRREFLLFLAHHIAAGSQSILFVSPMPDPNQSVVKMKSEVPGTVLRNRLLN
jgi:hypothetical protein